MRRVVQAGSYRFLSTKKGRKTKVVKPAKVDEINLDEYAMKAYLQSVYDAECKYHGELAERGSSRVGKPKVDHQVAEPMSVWDFGADDYLSRMASQHARSKHRS